MGGIHIWCAWVCRGAASGLLWRNRAALFYLQTTFNLIQGKNIKVPKIYGKVIIEVIAYDKRPEENNFYSRTNGSL